ncbi:MAG: beta-lactamase family protein [Candidatus Latescibacteria bacterium]|nr:beta-lactamase family protein [Candidatus Latescibacterota bacterium]
MAFRILYGLLLVTNLVTVAGAQDEIPLRINERTEDVVADLKRYIPRYMSERNIPGAALALIKDGETVWLEGFGVLNIFTSQPVNSETVFKFASNSKAITAYAALRLVDQGVLSLDEPLNSYISDPWLPPSPYRDVISLRHVLSHTSGLGHSTPSRENVFAPGLGYAYSAIGLQYLQAVMEQTTGQSLQQTGLELVFEPLGMSSSSYVLPESLRQRAANGHISGVIALVVYGMVCLVIALLGGTAGLVSLRFARGRWRPSRRQCLLFFFTVLFLADILIFYLLDLITLPDYAWTIVLGGTAGVILLWATLWGVGKLLLPRIGRRILRIGSAVLSALVAVSLILVLGANVVLPVPVSEHQLPQAAASVSATVGDMAAFMVELGRPRHLSSEQSTQLRAPQVRLHESLSWGLGPGIMHTEQGDVLWQWGQHVDFQSVAMIYQDLGFGVVAVTSSDLLAPDVAIEMAHYAVGGRIDPIVRASGLAFNYNPGE